MTSTAPHLDTLTRTAAGHLVPLDVCLELTHRCNFRCVHCFIPDHTLDSDLPTSRILTLLDELADMGAFFLALSGGEPLSHPDWPIIARSARARGFVLRILTNGSLISPATAEELARLMARVDISFYSLHADTFDTITGVPGSFSAVRRGIDQLCQAGVPVTLKVPLMADNADHLDDIIAFAEGIGLPWQTYPTLIHRKDGDPGPTSRRATARQLGRFFCGPHSPHPHLPDQSPPPAGDRIVCAAGFRSVTIGPTGDVLACVSLPAPAGNIRHDSFRRIWEDSPWLQRLRRLRVRDLETCSTCVKFTYCNRCPAQALAETGDLLGVSPSACALAEVIERAHGREH